MAKAKEAINTLVRFRLIHTPCCGALLCWINPRFPNFCPECGKQIYPDIKHNVLEEQDMWLVSKLGAK